MNVAPKFLTMSGNALFGYAAAMAESAEMIRAFPDAATAVAMMLEREGLVASNLASRQQEALSQDERDMVGLADAVADAVGLTTLDEKPDAGALVDGAAEEEQPADLQEKPAAFGFVTPLYSEERIALLRRLVPTVMELEQILPLVNALPGEGQITSVSSLRVKCGLMGIHRRKQPIPAEFLLQSGQPDQRQWDPADGVAEADFAEALQLVDNGWHGRQLAEWFGWSLDVASAFATKYRRADNANG
jgi:hypothetical protein